MRLATAAATLCLLWNPAFADALSIELNATETRDAGCRLVFTAQSEAGLDALVLETAIFDAEGGDALLTLFDFMELPAGRLRVRQFDIVDHSCEGLSALLFNGIETCLGGGCSAGLAATSRIEALEVLQ